jgi:hypothetical protein
MREEKVCVRMAQMMTLNCHESGWKAAQGAGGPAVPEVSSEDSRSVVLGRKEFPIWRVPGKREVIKSE